MFKSYLTSSLRFLAKNKGFTLLNIVGLTVGTLCCVYILLYVRDQYSYDRYFTDAKDIYRVVSHTQENGVEHFRATTSPPVSPALRADLSNMLKSTRVIPTIGSDEHLLIFEDRWIYEKNAYLVDSNFFDLFDFHFIAGDPEHAFTVNNAVVLSKTTAEKVFGIGDVINKRIEIENSSGDAFYVVTGVVDDSPGKSSIQANIYFRLNPDGAGADLLADNHWTDHQIVYTFIKLKPGASREEIERKLPEFVNGHTNGQAAINDKLALQPITEIHTTGAYELEMSKTVSSFFLAILAGIAILIQLIACINFMNLSTARAAKRAKEVGVRKIIGADSKGLILQFLVESMTLSVMAVLIAMPLLFSLLPWLNHVTGADISRAVFYNPVVWVLLLLVAFLTGLLAGSYPAYYLSAFHASKVIKGDLSSHVSVAGLRRSLVVFQFVLSIVLIASVIIIREQLDFVQKKDLGFTRDKQLVFNFHTFATRRCADYFAIALRQIPEVAEASRTDNYPGGYHFEDERVYPRGNASMASETQRLSSDEHFIKTMGIALLSGRDFHADDTGCVLVNETLAQKLGLNSTTAAGTSILGTNGHEYKILGVTKDFNFQSLHEKVSPFMIVYELRQDGFNHLIVRANTTDYHALLAKMYVFWHKRVFIAPYEYDFLNDIVQKMYETEIIMARIINTFTIMAILISCLGLFGLAAFSAEQRTKEIGIRKVMGASVPQLVGMLSTDFFQLICIAFFVALPLSWWAMNKWLDAFAYHIGIAWWTYAVAGGMVFVITMMIVGFQAMKAAVVNPVKSLRVE